MINTGMILRKSYESALEKALKRSPVVSLLGPRQCGKTTLARMIEKKIALVPLDKIETIQGVV
jgi:predicted AAA+ superfamily ATPase